jgi:hypothetical protein
LLASSPRTSSSPSSPPRSIAATRTLEADVPSPEP